ncbi:hypothetical protein DYB35_012400 [Aphanomyces astaci]|nr:hypothetical protein DYB35_012400 [Aphanomyces astaci]
MTRPRRVRRYDHVERMLLLQHAGYSRKQVAMCCFEGIAIRKSRLASNEDAEIERLKKRRRGYEDAVALTPGAPKRATHCL